MRKGLFTPIQELGKTLRDSESHVDSIIEFETKSHYGGPELVLRYPCKN
jgi:hypothetical protein